MKLSELIAELDRIKNERGDIDIQLQSNPSDPANEIVNSTTFFVVDELYDDGWRVNLRSWPY